MFPVPEFAIRPKLKLEKLVSEFSLVADVVAQVEVVRHPDKLFWTLKRKVRLRLGLARPKSAEQTHCGPAAANRFVSRRRSSSGAAGLPSWHRRANCRLPSFQPPQPPSDIRLLVKVLQ